MTTYISADVAKKLTRLVLVCFLVMMAVLLYVLWQSYEGRVDLVTYSRAECERGKNDRDANARGWRTAQAARTAYVARALRVTIITAETMIWQEPKPDDNADLIAARNYNEIASGLEERSKIDCTKVFPKASLVP